MAPEVVVALITAGAAFAVSVVSVPLNHLIRQQTRRSQTLDLMGRYSDPLLWAVHDLRSRIRTILDEGFLERYLVKAEDTILASGDAFMRPYARRHTMFVLAQYLGWVEILRRDVGFLDLGDRHRNRKLVELLSVIRRVLFAADLDPAFHVPAGHQRAIGELMIAADDPVPGQGRCIGFAAFCRLLDNDPGFAAWFERIEAGIVAYAYHPEQGSRLLELNARLSDLIEFLDPDLTRFPLRHEEQSRYLPNKATSADAGEFMLPVVPTENQRQERIQTGPVMAENPSPAREEGTERHH
jgi:hypothetical protein